MILYPAMDLIDGKCVRLSKGQFDAKTEYNDDPRAQAASFADQGANWLHVVDLDGTKAGEPLQANFIQSCVQGLGLKVQTGGGIRSLDSAKQVLDAGIDRVVIGSLSVSKPEAMGSLVQDYGSERVVAALDLVMQDGAPFIATHGWQAVSSQPLADACRAMIDQGVTHILMTDISKDGLLQGPNVDLYRQASHDFPQLKIQASGGVSSLDDLRQLTNSGADGVIVGKALYEDRFTVAQALEALC